MGRTISGCAPPLRCYVKVGVASEHKGPARRGPDAPGFSIYLFACSAIGLTYGDAVWPSDWISRLITTVMLAILMSAWCV